MSEELLRYVITAYERKLKECMTEDGYRQFFTDTINNFFREFANAFTESEVDE